MSLLNDVATELVYPLLPIFLVSIGGSAATLGWMEGLADSVSAGVKWLSGRWSDARARKPFVIGGYALATFVRPLIAFATAPWHVVAIRATDRIGKGVRSAPRDALLAQAVPPERRGHAFGFLQMMDNLGATIGPLIALVLLRGLGWSLRTVFALTLVPGLVALATVVWGVHEGTERAYADPSTRPAGSLARSAANQASPLPRELRAYLGVVGLFTLGSSADSFLMLRLHDLGLGAGWIPVAWLTLNASKSLLDVGGGKLSDRFGRWRTQIAGWLLYAAAYALFPETRSVAVTWALLLFYGAYYGLTEGGEKALVADLAPAESRGRAYGALYAITGAAVLPANVVFGALYVHYAEWAFRASAACALVAAIGLAVVSRGRARVDDSTR